MSIGWVIGRLASAARLAGIAGPLPIFGAAASLVVGLVAFVDHLPYWQVVFVLAAAGLVLSFVEWALAHRFAAHVSAESASRSAEMREAIRGVIGEALRPIKEDMANMTMVFDGSATEFSRLRDSVEGMQVGMDKLAELDARVTKIEARLRGESP